MIILNLFSCVNNYPLTTISSFGEKIAAQIIPYHTMNANLKCIKNKVSQNSVYTLNKEELNQVKDAFINCNNLFADKLLNNLSQLPPDIVKNAIALAFETNDATKATTSLTRFLESLNENNLIQLSGNNKERLNQIFDKNVLLRDKAINSVLTTKGKALWKAAYSEVFYFFHHLIQMLIGMTGYNEIGGEKVSRYDHSNVGSYEAKSKLEFYATLLGYPSILFASAFAFTGSAALAGMTTGIMILCSILFIPIYMKYLKPCPHQVMGLENLNQKVLNSESSLLFERADVLNSIQDAFCLGKGVILHGEPGAGKTSLADSFASLIVSKKAKEGSEFLNSAQIFSVNANQFKNNYGHDSVSFQSLSEHFGDYKKSFVLFIDEIASLYQEDPDTGNNAVKSLLTFLDKFPNVICATTTAEYDKFIKNDPTVNFRRLIPVKLDPLKTEEMMIALFQYLHHNAPELTVEENIHEPGKQSRDAIAYIIEKASVFNSQTSKIDAAISLLKSAIVKATHITFKDLEKNVTDLKLEIDYLEKHLLHTESTDNMQRYTQKQKELKEAQEKLTKKTNALKQIKKIEAVSLKIKQQGYQLAVKKSSEAISKKWMVNYAKQQVLAEVLVKQRGSLGLPSGISKVLIDSIIQ